MAAAIAAGRVSHPKELAVDYAFLARDGAALGYGAVMPVRGGAAVAQARPAAPDTRSPNVLRCPKPCS